MSRYRVEVRVTPREGLLDPEGRAVQNALASLGFDGVESVRVGKLVNVLVTADSEDDAVDRVREMCDRLIANPVTEDYQVKMIGLEEVAGAAGSREEDADR